MKVALTGNPNSGKTTLFNAITGRVERVGNWPGVTIEKKKVWSNSACIRKRTRLLSLICRGRIQCRPLLPRKVSPVIS